MAIKDVIAMCMDYEHVLNSVEQKVNLVFLSFIILLWQ